MGRVKYFRVIREVVNGICSLCFKERSLVFLNLFDNWNVSEVYIINGVIIICFFFVSIGEMVIVGNIILLVVFVLNDYDIIFFSRKKVVWLVGFLVFILL